MTSERKASAILIMATILSAFGWIFSKETIQGLPPFGFVGLRFLIASLCLLPFCFRSLRRASWQDIRSAALVGCLLATALISWIHAISISDTLGEGAFILSLSMLMVPFVAWILFRQQPKRIFWLSLPIAMSGLAFLSLKDGWQSSSSQLWFLFNAVVLALHFNINSKYSQTLPILLLTCIQLFVTGLIGLTASALFESVPLDVEPSIWGWFTASTILATALRYVMQTMAQKQINPGNAALIMILEPVWTVFLSIGWYGEVLTLSKLVGCSLILFSLILYRTDGKLLSLLRRTQSAAGD
ncbi:EamA family transporter [Vibrio navarrensis]|uniref:DMT family transporter n=1 Tax=Vibrio navarrensis TaxID=29495 RepID=A0AAJ4IEV5_9VIBR|nr:MULTISPECIES: DMT family transporter [Vibrio]KJR30658.1 membrane protein [Vibrio sp. S234-5]MBE3655106.1 EamA family transporter [Vibrio navarrensis]MBE3659760.1 EamA family transporter [Vibrio navarrensis]MBE4604063.1 EamA family transporter [Vibrio navarrensis]QPL55498.1 DMT family transporter [Vibrio navarrensis]